MHLENELLQIVASQKKKCDCSMFFFFFVNFVPVSEAANYFALARRTLQKFLRSALGSWHLRSRWQRNFGSGKSKQVVHRLAARLTDPSAVFPSDCTHHCRSATTQTATRACLHEPT